jgi:ribosomal protein S6--L-glutamate ligase
MMIDGAACLDGPRHDVAAEPGAVAVLAEARYLAQRQPTGLVAALRRRGVEPIVIDPASAPLPVAPAVVVARGRSPAVLDALAALERRGVPTLNRSEAVRAVLDKRSMAAALTAAGLPTPRTVAVPGAELARATSAGPFPLVLKPVLGDNARDVTLVPDRATLDALRWHEPVALAQPFVAGDGRDLKLYVAGGEVWAVRKPSPLLDRDWRSAPAERAPLRGELRDVALACGRVFGLELFGVDCVLSRGGVVVIEVNDFPNYSGLPEADERLADHVLGRAGARVAP